MLSPWDLPLIGQEPKVLCALLVLPMGAFFAIKVDPMQRHDLTDVTLNRKARRGLGVITRFFDATRGKSSQSPVTEVLSVARICIMKPRICIIKQVEVRLRVRHRSHLVAG